MNINNLYSNLAPVYDQGLVVNNYSRAVRFFVSQLPFSSKESFNVLDAGCGTGLFTKAVLNRFPLVKVTAVDINPAMLEQLKRWLYRNDLRNRAEILESDILLVSFPAKQEFDLIITGGLLEHLVDPFGGVEYLSKNCLKEGGYFFNSAVKRNLWGKFVGYSMNFKPFILSYNTRLFSRTNIELVKIIHLPLISYFPISLVKIGLLGRRN